MTIKEINKIYKKRLLIMFGVFVLCLILQALGMILVLKDYACGVICFVPPPLAVFWFWNIDKFLR